MSFKSFANRTPPTTSEYAKAFERFVATDWAKETGYKGRLSFTPWNEPNNKAQDGNGLGVQLDARLVARYYLAAERACRKHPTQCNVVAAGDFASNGDMWNDFEWNCSNDNVAPSDLCKTNSSVNPSGEPASYLDRYKNEIANRATQFGLPKGFRPEVFAFHGWHDTNNYLNEGAHCATYDTCALRRILRSLSGSWGHVALWNTEDGIGQHDELDDDKQANGAAFLLRLQTITTRVHRLYITRLHGGSTELVRENRELVNGMPVKERSPRPAMCVLAKRRLTYMSGTPIGLNCQNLVDPH